MSITGAIKRRLRPLKKKFDKRKKEKAKERKREMMKKIRAEEKVVDNRIAIMTNTFRYTCNPKYIYEEIKRQDPGYEVTWLVADSDAEGYPEDVHKVKYNSEEGLRAVYSSKVWLDNGIAFSNYFDKKEDQLHLQTMHGSLGIKIIDNAVKSRNERNDHGRLVVKRETENTNYVITNSEFEESVFRRVFWKDTPMVRLGHARTDILFSKDEELISGIRRELNRRYGIPEDKKILMYAPTHRRGLTAEDLYIDYPRFLKVLSEKFGGEFVVLLRLHDRTKDLKPAGLELDYVYEVSDYPDMQELMLVTDVGITDYSSWIFDYVLMKRPGFMYATDIDRYNNRTGLAYPLEESPFPVAYTPDELIERAESFDQELFEKRVDEFLEGKGSVDEGHSAKDIVDWLQTIAPVSKQEKTPEGEE